MLSPKAKESRFKRSEKKESVTKDETKMVVYGEKADNRSLESALMKKINSTNLKQKLAQTIKTSMSIRNNANQLAFMFQDHFNTLNRERVIGLLCLVIMDRHG